MWFLLGLMTGVALGLLMVPAPGEQTRAELADKARDLSRVPLQKTAEAAQASKEKAGEIGARVGRQAAEAAVQAVTDELMGKRQETA